MNTKKKPVGAPTPTPPEPVDGNDWPVSNGFSAMLIPVASIAPNPNQPRREFDEAALKELASSIQQHGLIQPITVEAVYPDEPGGELLYILHDGERRLRAHKLLEWPDIPAFILAHEHDGEALLMRAIIANDQRADLSPIERAAGYQKLVDEYGLSDLEIATQVGKSRSTVANIRRLLQLPEERQAQVAAGELSERQATALLPLYQLPAEIQAKLIENHWDGQKLKKPESLTSDEIRRHYRAALNYQAHDLALIDPAESYPGEGIRSATCTGCDLYITIGKDSEKSCLDGDCLAVKQEQVISAYLRHAHEATGVAPLESDVAYGHLGEFYGTAGANALALALEKPCPNLRLAYKRRSWDSGPGPEQFDRCRYLCHNGQGCACWDQMTAVERKRDTDHKKNVQRLADKTKHHLAQVANSDPELFLKAILHTTTHNWNGYDEKMLGLAHDKVIQRLTRWLVDNNLRLSTYNSLEDNRQRVDDWLAKVGFPALEIEEAADEQ